MKGQWIIWIKILNIYLRVDGRPANHIANKDIIKLAKSVSKWAASVAMAKLFDITPPTTSRHINTTHNILAMISFFRACVSIPRGLSSSVWQCSINYKEKKVNFSVICKWNSILGSEKKNFYTYFQFVTVPALVHYNNFLIDDHANNKQLMEIHSVLPLRMILYRECWNSKKREKLFNNTANIKVNLNWLLKCHFIRLEKKKHIILFNLILFFIFYSIDWSFLIVLQYLALSL